MVRPQRESQRQIAARMPLVLRVPAESIKSQTVPSDGRKILIKIRKVRVRTRWIYSTEKKGSIVCGAICPVPLKLKPSPEKSLRRKSSPKPNLCLAMVFTRSSDIWYEVVLEPAGFA